MKAIYAILVLGLLTSCSMSEKISGASDLKACLVQAAQAHIADGSAFAAPVRTTVKSMLSTCLVPEDQKSEWTPIAQSILTALMTREES